MQRSVSDTSASQHINGGILRSGGAGRMVGDDCDTLYLQTPSLSSVATGTNGPIGATILKAGSNTTLPHSRCYDIVGTLPPDRSVLDVRFDPGDVGTIPPDKNFL